jgi:hypothetical protein
MKRRTSPPALPGGAGAQAAGDADPSGEALGTWVAQPDSRSTHSKPESDRFRCLLTMPGEARKCGRRGKSSSSMVSLSQRVCNKGFVAASALTLVAMRNRVNKGDSVLAEPGPHAADDRRHGGDRGQAEGPKEGAAVGTGLRDYGPMAGRKTRCTYTRKQGFVVPTIVNRRKPESQENPGKYDMRAITR